MKWHKTILRALCCYNTTIRHTFLIKINSKFFVFLSGAQKHLNSMAWLGLRFYPFLIGLEGLLGESRGIVLLSVYLGTRWGWVVSTKPRPPCPRERPGTHCIGGWVGLGALLDMCGKSRPHRDSIPGPSSP